jgi:hypothetical protein
MRKMSWTPSFRVTALVVILTLAPGLAAVGPAAALSVSEQTEFNESRVGETVETTVVVEDPFQDQPSQWTLRASTELENVSWVVTVSQQGNQVNQETYGGQSFEQDLNFDNGGDEVRIKVTGEVPAVDNYTYEPRETYTLWELDAITGDSESALNDSAVHHYTNDSRDARQAIDEAAVAINESGNPQEARTTLNSSISAYDNGNFGNAVDLAERAQNEAEQVQQSQQRTQMLIYAAIAVVVLLVVGGVVYYWRQQQDEYGKLQ